MTPQINNKNNNYYSDDNVGRLTTSSTTGTFYFAYGSNLSPVQMSLRLRHSPSSSVPVAIARLDNHSWIICKRGYANVVSLTQPSRSESQDPLNDSLQPFKFPESESESEEDSADSVVWGVLYNMHPADESRLDMYEGHNEARNPEPQPNPDEETKHFKSHLQGGWDYNKHYLPVTVTKWLTGNPKDYGVQVPNPTEPGNDSTTSGTNTTATVRALVYVDEYRTEPGTIVHEYIGRMNRGIQESVGLGLPAPWVAKVMRKFIPEGIHVEDLAYVGTDEGYVEDV